MKVKSYILPLLSLALLASCGGESSSHATGLTSHATGLSSSTQSATYLDWVADNKIVIDLFATGDARFAYGNAALTQASTTLDLSDSAALTCSTQLQAEQVYNFVYVTEGVSGTGFSAGAALYAGIVGDQISEFLNGKDDLKGKTRAYVAISFGSTVSWAKGKNAAMDAKIQQLVDAAK